MKKLSLLVVVIAIVGYAVFVVTKDEDTDHVERWANVLGSSTHQMETFLRGVTGIQDRADLNRHIATKHPDWSAFLSGRNVSFNKLVEAYEHGNSMSERERNIRLRESLNAIAEAIKDVRSAYVREDQQLIESLGIYSHVLDIFGSEEYRSVDSPSVLQASTNPFLTAGDVETWKRTTAILSAFEVEAQRNAEIGRVFSGVPFEEPLMVVERMRHEPVLFALLANIPTHKALGELFEVLKKELPRPRN